MPEFIYDSIHKFQEELGRRLSFIGNCSMSELKLWTRFLGRVVILEPDEYKYYQKHLAIFTLGIQRELPYNAIKNCDFAEAVNKHYLYGWPHDIVYFGTQTVIDISLLANIFSLNKGRDFLIINAKAKQNKIPKDLPGKSFNLTVRIESKDKSIETIRVTSQIEGSQEETEQNG